MKDRRDKALRSLHLILIAVSSDGFHEHDGREGPQASPSRRHTA